MTAYELEKEIERLLDASSVERVLDALSNVCSEKASHCRETWQDRQLARTWDMDSKAIAKVALQVKN